MKSHNLVMWWIKEGTYPTIDEAKAKLKHLDLEGPGPEAFNFKTTFSPLGDRLKINFPDN